MKNSKFIESDYLELYPDVADAIKKKFFLNGYEHFVKHGKAEGRLPSIPPGITPREKAVFFLINKNGLGLEIGPCHNPIAPKKKGYNVQILDHQSSDELRNKYQNQGLNLDNIEEVDFIWQGESLTELTGKKNYYDWIIASHVIEHIPDLISFLQQCYSLLKPEGILSLVIPDKRYCFDYFQPLSTTGMLLDAHFEKRKRPSPGQVFDHFANAVTSNGKIAWSQNSEIPDDLIHSFDIAREYWLSTTKTNKYFDLHCWRFTPESFNFILNDLKQLNLINLEVKVQFPTNGCEFYTSLGKFKKINNNVTSRLKKLSSIYTPSYNINNENK